MGGDFCLPLFFYKVEKMLMASQFDFFISSLNIVFSFRL